MPELPEVEVVRAGLARWLSGAVVREVEVRHPRSVRGHEAGPVDFAARLDGVGIVGVARRGKYCWLVLDSGEALLAHLGMSGQLLLRPPSAPDEAHLRVRVRLRGGPELAGRELAGRELAGRELRFVDQRMFGGLAVVDLVPTPDGLPAGRGAGPWLPAPVMHIARDVLDPALVEAELVGRIRRRRTGIKRALLDQGLVSGIGNIYADEALWRVRLHYARATDTTPRPRIVELLGAARAVMAEALAAGGTSFDSLYVDVNGSSGYFERSLAVYGREGRPCSRCATPVRRDAFMNRSSFTCPRCQPRPRNGRW